jgi:hypothetical protein
MNKIRLWWWKRLILTTVLKGAWRDIWNYLIPAREVAPSLDHVADLSIYKSVEHQAARLEQQQRYSHRLKRWESHSGYNMLLQRCNPYQSTHFLSVLYAVEILARPAWQRTRPVASANVPGLVVSTAKSAHDGRGYTSQIGSHQFHPSNHLFVTLFGSTW